MGRSQKPKRITWASDGNLCQGLDCKFQPIAEFRNWTTRYRNGTSDSPIPKLGKHSWVVNKS